MICFIYISSKCYGNRTCIFPDIVEYYTKRDIFSVNQLSFLHNKEIKDNLIRFCKIDYIKAEFKDIESFSPQNVILITGNGTIPITDKLTENMPDNIIRWYGVNNLSKNKKVISIPLGCENSIESYREGHGIAHNKAIKRNKKLNDIFSQGNVQNPCRFVYANWNNHTFPEWRIHVMNEAKKYDHITIESNRETPSEAPNTEERVKKMGSMELFGKRKMVTIEPIMDFDVPSLVDMVKRIRQVFGICKLLTKKP